MEPAAATARFPGWLRVIVIGRDPRRTLVRAAILAVMCFVAFKFFVFKLVVLPVQVQGNSMFPTYHDHARNFVMGLAYWRTNPQRGDIVAIRMAGPSVMLLKRIVGLPGETIAFVHGRLIVNGEKIAEPYMKNHLPAPDLEPVKLRAGEYYVIGDNRMNSDRGRVDRGRIMGRIIL